MDNPVRKVTILQAGFLNKVYSFHGFGHTYHDHPYEETIMLQKTYAIVEGPETGEVHEIEPTSITFLEPE